MARWYPPSPFGGSGDGGCESYALSIIVRLATLELGERHPSSVRRSAHLLARRGMVELGYVTLNEIDWRGTEYSRRYARWPFA